MPRLSPLVLAVAIATALVSPAGATSATVRITLSATGADADAAGSGRLKIRDRRSTLSGQLDVRTRRLDANATHQVTIDGVVVGSLTTGRSGKGRARFRTNPVTDRDQLLGVDPRGRVIAILSGTGTAVLTAAVGTRGLDPNDVRCCLPDDSGPECEDRTAAECAAAGGVDMGAGSCLPNPCGITTPTGPGADVVCCLPDDSGPECEDRTPAECAAQGGINLGPGVCVPNPCAPVGGSTSTTLPGGGSPAIVVTCERRADRSRASVNGNDLASGNYKARLTSGANVATSGLAATVGDEIEFDFDSQPDDIAAGATAIATTFLQGAPPQATGAILDSADQVVVSATVACSQQ